MSGFLAVAIGLGLVSLLTTVFVMARKRRLRSQTPAARCQRDIREIHRNTYLRTKRRRGRQLDNPEATSMGTHGGGGAGLV